MYDSGSVSGCGLDGNDAAGLDHTNAPRFNGATESLRGVDMS